MTAPALARDAPPPPAAPVEMHSEQGPGTVSAGARRMRRLRERRRGGCLFVAPVEILESDVAALVRSGRLAPDCRGDRAAVLAAIERLRDDFSRRAGVRA